MSRDREEFTRAVKVAAFERAHGLCEWKYDDGRRDDQVCAKILTTGDIHYDHRIPWAISFDSSLSNCQCLCKAHHLLKTTKTDVPTIAKVKRVHANHIGAKKPGRGFNSRLSKRFDGTVIDKSTGQPVSGGRTR